jgi:hypothetical protein
VRCIRREYSDSIARREGINGGDVSLWIAGSGVGRKRREGSVEVVVNGRDILLEVFTFGGFVIFVVSSVALWWAYVSLGIWCRMSRPC